MSTGKHTPGPWHLNTQYADIEVRGPAESGVLIAAMSPWGVAADGPNPQLANARLIAAAPELLQSIEQLYIRLADYRSSDWPVRHSLEGQALLCSLRDVIAAATGREPQDVQDDFGTRAAKAATGGSHG